MFGDFIKVVAVLTLFVWVVTAQHVSYGRPHYRQYDDEDYYHIYEPSHRQSEYPHYQPQMYKHKPITYVPDYKPSPQNYKIEDFAADYVSKPAYNLEESYKLADYRPFDIRTESIDITKGQPEYTTEPLVIRVPPSRSSGVQNHRVMNGIIPHY